jgi:fructokinase
MSRHTLNRDRTPVVVGLGEILWDLLPGGKQLGGAPANFAYHAKAMGAEAYAVSCVGGDELGDEILQRLAALGLSDDYVAVEATLPTGTVSVALDADGKPTYVIHEDVAWDFIAPRPELQGLAARTDCVCFGSLAQRSAVSRTTIRDFVTATRDDCLRIFDVNLRQHYFNIDTIAPGLSWATVLKLNDEELPVLAKLVSIEGTATEMLATFCRRYNLDLIALTSGGQGSLLFTLDAQSIQPGLPVDVADTVGAGDAFTAALAMGLLAGLELDVIAANANRVATYVCSQAGATPPLPDELCAFLQRK